MGLIITAVTAIGLGVIWIWSVILAIAGLFWLLTGLVTYYTGYE